MKTNVQRVINHPLRQSRANDDAQRAQQTENYKAFKDRIARFCIIFPDELHLPKEVEEKICRENAKRLFWNRKPEK